MLSNISMSDCRDGLSQDPHRPFMPLVTVKCDKCKGSGKQRYPASEETYFESY